MEQKPILETKSLSKNFGSLKAVNNVEFRVRQGHIHSIIGPNGAGKTTLFNLLNGFLLPTSGKIFFKGSDITNLPPYKISQKGIGRSFQITSVFPDLPVLENIRIAAQSRTKMSYHFLKSAKSLKSLEEKAYQVLDRVGLEGKRDQLAKNLSHGEKRILDIGIGLATEPSLLLLDEPASGLAKEEISKVIKLVKHLSKEITIILIEHNIDLVLSISDRITVLFQGSVIADDTPEQIQKDSRVQEAYLGGY